MGGGGSDDDDDAPVYFARPMYTATQGAQMSEMSQAALSRSSADNTTQPIHRIVDGRDAGLATEAKTPIVLAMDVTASRGNDSKIIYDKLPMFFGQMMMCDYCPEPTLSFAAIGDAPYEDKAPLQVCSWDSGTSLDDWIKKLWLEEGGGGSGEESYELAAYYYAKYCNMSPGRKGLFFFTGDEHFYDVLQKEVVKTHIGDDLEADLPASAIFAKLQDKFDVFMLYPFKEEALRQKDIQQELRKRLQREKAKSGEITISLMWDTSDDLDIHVVPPGDKGEINFSQKKRAGGELDVDMNAASPYSKEPVENVFWPPFVPGMEGPPHGEYRVYLENYSRRDTQDSNWTCAVSVGGATQIFQGISTRNKERIEVHKFQYTGHISSGGQNATMTAGKLARSDAKGYDSDSIYADWCRVLPQSRVMKFQTPKAIIDILLGVISIRCGSRTRSEYVADLKERGQDEERQNEVNGVLEAWELGESKALEWVKCFTDSHRDKFVREFQTPSFGGYASTAAPRPSMEKKYRACAGAVVFNRRGDVLVGERSDKLGQWQFPQGGTDGEEHSQAARRELYEEMGLKDPAVTYVGLAPQAMRYDVPPGTWLENAGFAGQEMKFALFFLDVDDDGDPEKHCNLSGLGGEQREFNAVRWISWEPLVDQVVGFRKDVYQQLQHLAKPLISDFLGRLPLAQQSRGTA